MRFDDSRFPLVLVSMQDRLGADQAEELCGFLTAQLRRARAEERDIACVLDTRGVTRLDAVFRRDMGKWEKDLSPALFERVALRVLIAQSPLVRGAITAVAWMSPRGKGTVPAENMAQACEMLRQCGAQIPPADLRWLLESERAGQSGT